MLNSKHTFKWRELLTLTYQIKFGYLRIFNLYDKINFKIVLVKLQIVCY
jgi:hypothetical protein